MARVGVVPRPARVDLPPLLTRGMKKALLQKKEGQE